MANAKNTQRPQGGPGSGGSDRNPQRANLADIRERMAVVGSCGNRVGVVDHIEGNAIKLTRNDSRDGEHHYIPVGWVETVDNEVHLGKNSQEACQQWKSSVSEC